MAAEQSDADHNTIANFRKNNPEAIKRVFRATVELAKGHNLIGGKIIAGDGTWSSPLKVGQFSFRFEK